MEQGAVRRLVVERGLVAAAFGQLTDAFTTLPFEALGPVKTLLKRYLSTGPWSAEDGDALAAAVGPGEGWWERPLDGGITLAFGWEGGRFRVALRAEGEDGGGPGRAPAPSDPLEATFDGPVVPEATPNPRTIRFGFSHTVGDGPSRWYESVAAAGDDPRVARLFGESDRVANVLVGPDFVAVGLRRPADWEQLLGPLLAAVTEAFADPLQGGGVARPTGAAGGPAWLAGRPPTDPAPSRRPTRLEQAWQELGGLRPARPDDLEKVLTASGDTDHARRQVAANLLGEADPAVARDHWHRLAHDSVRAVRRAAVDAMVDARRHDLRPLLESALDDPDAWVRWKALRGLVELGPAASRDAVAAKAADPDFRVRLEAAAALREPGG